jgi:succinyl-diaminopimelate desuccinylase
MQEGQADLGIWLHGDVVAAGDGWHFPPYDATLYKNCIIGRGATDNKGQLASIFQLFKIFRALGIKLKYNPALYVGSCEESGMLDMKGIEGNPDAKGFINVCTPPRLSLVPDGSFPIAYGAKGLTDFVLKSRQALSFQLTAGEASEPGVARAVFACDILGEFPDCTVEKGEKTAISAFCTPCHSARPSEDGNEITRLCTALLPCHAVSACEREILAFFRDVSLDIHGQIFGIDIPTSDKTRTVVSAQAITCENGYPALHLRVRYPIELTHEALYEGIARLADAHGFDVCEKSSHAPYVNDRESPAVKRLAEIANEITGKDVPPYVNGATYAHYLPNAYVFGMEGCCPPDDFEKGRGGAHGVDEAVSIFRLKRAMRIYARALLALDELTW